MERRGKKPLVRFFYAITEQTEIRVTGSLSDGGEDRRRRVVCCMPSIYTESASLAPGSWLLFYSLALLILLNTQRRRSNIPPFFFIQLSPLASGRVGPLSTWFISSSYNASSYRLLSLYLSLSLFSMGRKEGHRRPGSSLKRSSEYYKLISHTKMRLLPWRPSSSCSFFSPSPCIHYLKCCISAMYWKNILSRLTVGSCIHSFLFVFFFFGLYCSLWK